MREEGVVETEIVLGKEYCDKVTGFEGVATARSQFLYGCERIQLEHLQAGEVKAHWFDAPTLVETGEGPGITGSQETGGDRPAPPRTGH